LRQIVRCEPERFGKYRYVLEVRWGEGERLAVILKNPSTASAERSDPTVGKVEAWARRHGYGTLTIVNLFALRSTDPVELNRHPYAVAVGPENDRYIREAIDDADTIIAAWGNPNGIERERYDRRIAEVLIILKSRPTTIGPLTKLGYPRHGLMWNNQ
jgi:hypothetical protein